MKKVFHFLLHSLLAILIMFEYFYFLWFWGGDGEFAFLGCGISFIIFLLIHIFLFRKTQNRGKKKMIIYSAMIVTPILSVITIYLILAPLFGVTIQIA